MDNMSHLSIMLEMYVELSNKIKNIATQHLDAYDMMTFEQRLYTIKFMLRSARRQLEEIGGLGGLDKEVEISLKYGLYQLEFLAAEITVIEPKGTVYVLPSLSSGQFNLVHFSCFMSKKIGLLLIFLFHKSVYLIIYNYTIKYTTTY